MTALPVDVWLLVFDTVDNLDTLWSVVRNTSHYLRDCVDEYFHHGVIQNTFLHLYYSTINRYGGPIFQYLRLPMRFNCFSDNGTRAVFCQVEFQKQTGLTTHGSVRGWLPFIERYCEEMLQPRPKVLNKSQSAIGPPVWEKEHALLRNTLTVADKSSYLMQLRDHTSIGRGDRPPYYLKIRDYVHDTKLVDLIIDCQKRELSFDWRCTFSAFFKEQHFLALAEGNTPSRIPLFDENLSPTALHLRYYGYTRDNIGAGGRVRRKRLHSWVGRNKHRMTREHRLLTEFRVEIEKGNVLRFLCTENLQNIQDVLSESEEYVPEKCADDHLDLLSWPWCDDDAFFVPKRRFGQLHKRCVVL